MGEGQTETLLGQLLIPGQLDRALRQQARLRGRAKEGSAFVLVVENDPEASAVVAEILESAGFQVGVARDEAEALAAMLGPEPLRPVAIILDLALQTHRGVELLSVLREKPAARYLPVVVLAGHVQLEQDIRSRGLQISEFLTKPVAARRLVEVVESALQDAREMQRKQRV
jgi:chemotaxis family two-component system response regulator PixG